jgi:hypothetical protein
MKKTIVVLKIWRKNDSQVDLNLQSQMEGYFHRTLQGLQR